MRSVFRVVIVLILCVAISPSCAATDRHSKKSTTGKKAASKQKRGTAPGKATRPAIAPSQAPSQNIPHPVLEVLDPRVSSPLGPVVSEPRTLSLRVRASQARRVWLYYQPDAGETRRYFLGHDMAERVFDWQLDTTTGGKLFAAAEAPDGAMAYSTAVRVESGAYHALLRAVSTDPHLRIEVNLPAFELSVYRDSQLLKRYRVGIGQKEWPVPPGLRTARAIVWNPEWMPPSSPWATAPLVARLKARGEVLGRYKIPLGGEILIHGTSRRTDLGRLVSHGCIRMLNSDLAEFANIVLRETGTVVPANNIKRAQRNKKFSFAAALPRPPIVAIRYDPVVLRAGKVQVYKDVYGWTSGEDEQMARLAAYADPIDRAPAAATAGKRKPRPALALQSAKAARRGRNRGRAKRTARRSRLSRAPARSLTSQ